MTNTPKATVAAIITRQMDGATQILLTRRNVPPFKGQWCLPGGHLDRYEPIKEAIRREVREETGLEFDAAFFGSFDEIMPKHNIHAVVSVFAGEGSGTLQAQESEVSEINWFSLHDACEQDLAFKHNDIVICYRDRNATNG